MKRLALLLAPLALLLPSVGWGQNTNTLPPACTVAGLSAGCVPAVRGVVARVVDGADATDCDTGSGTTTVVCTFDGTVWSPVGGMSTQGDYIHNTTDGVFDFFRDESGIIFLRANDTDGTTDMELLAGANSISIGDDSATQVHIETEGMEVLVDANGNTASFIASTTGSSVIDMRDYGDTTDDDMAHTSLSTNCTTTTTGAEDCDLTVQVVEAGTALTRLTIDADGDATFAPEPADGGNGNLQHQIIGIPKIAGFSLGTGNDGSETTNVDFGDSETPDTDWTQTANVTTSNETTIFRKGTASLELLVGATPADGNGADCDLAGATGAQNWSADESFGLWRYCTIVDGAAGDWVLEITDSVAGATEVALPEYTVANTWVWTEVDISGVADASKDVVNSIALDLSAAGATTYAAGATCYFDYMWKWDAAEELAISADIYEDGILSMFSVITAGAAITPILEVEGTDFFVHYEAGNDFIVPITNLSADSLWGMAALE